jgi:hypothetical protein
MKIVFHSNQLSLRGTEIALYDYAFFNRKLLGNESIVVFDKNNPHNDPEVIRKFQREFTTVPYQAFTEVDSVIREHGADLLYCIKSGKRDGKTSRVVPTMVHAVFPTSLDHVHGSAYAFVSDWLACVCANGKLPAVPHMVHLPRLGSDVTKDLRAELNIPEEATVFGCYGGATSFDIGFVKKEAIPRALQARPDLYFVFLNIDRFIDHPRVLFLPGSSSIEYKVRFINTTDAMLHARQVGESFGLACAEFSILNKPVLTYARSRDRNHLLVLGERALIYSAPRELLQLLLRFDRRAMAKMNWDAYSAHFNPERVMHLFERNLVRPALGAGVANRPAAKFGWHEKIRSRIKLLQLKLG